MQNTVQCVIVFCRSCVTHGFHNSLGPAFARPRWPSSGTGVAPTPHRHTLLRAKPPKDGDAELQGTTAAQGRHVSPGDSVAVVVSWSASGGSITSSGLYAADTNAGTYQVTATAPVAATAPAAAAPTNARASGSSTVKNTGPLTQVILSPATASVLVGG